MGYWAHSLLSVPIAAIKDCFPHLFLFEKQALALSLSLPLSLSLSLSLFLSAQRQ